MHLLLPQVRMIPFENCEDARALIVFIQKDGIIRINEMQVRPEKLGSIIAEIVQYRHYGQVVYMLPDPDVSFGEFADIYNKIASSTNHLYIGLITRQLKTQLEQCPKGSICGFDWPDHGSAQSCLYYNPIRPHPHLSLR